MKVEVTEGLCRERGKRGVGSEEFEVRWEDDPPKSDSA